MGRLKGVKTGGHHKFSFRKRIKEIDDRLSLTEREKASYKKFMKEHTPPLKRKIYEAKR